MSDNPYEPPSEAFDRYIERVENSPEAQARRERLKRSAPRPFHPWRGGPAIGLMIVGVGLLARWLAGLAGLG